MEVPFGCRIDLSVKRQSESAIAGLPEDVVDESINLFENESSLQSISASVVNSYERFAEQYGNLVLGNRAIVDRLAGCAPSRVDDQACFQMFARKVGRLFLRRTISSSELTRYNALITRAVAASNYYVAPALLVQVFAQHPEFLYRFEMGTAISGTTLRELTNYEIASRMSYLIWGSAPDTTLMNAADSGILKDEMQREREARRMLADARARRQWKAYHAQWLGIRECHLTSDTFGGDDPGNEQAHRLHWFRFSSRMARSFHPR